MLQKKRRKVNKLGCIRELYEGCDDWENKKGEIEEKTTSNAEMVTKSVLQIMGVLRRF